MELRNCMHADIVRSRGNTLFPSIVDQKNKSLPLHLRPQWLKSLLTQTEDVTCGIYGGSIFSTLDSFWKEWISKQNYNEYGSAIVYFL